MRTPPRLFGRAAPGESKHFEVEPVGDGAYAAIARDGGDAFANAAIVDLGERTLVFDTFLTPQAAEDLRGAAERLLGRPVELVVNSHWHGDHVRGNQVFDGAEIVATARTRELMATLGAERLDQLKRDAAAELPNLRARLAREPADDRRSELEAQVEVASSAAAVELRLPTRVFDQGMALGAGELLTWGGGHTASDAFLVLPRERVAFVGDLLLTESHAWAGDGDVDEWIRILGRLETLPVDTFVAEHGRVGSRADLAALREYLEAVAAIGRAGTGMLPRFVALKWPEIWARNATALREKVATKTA